MKQLTEQQRTGEWEMKKYKVCVTYLASVYIEVEADSLEDAEELAIERAQDEQLYDGLEITAEAFEQEEGEMK